MADSTDPQAPSPSGADLQRAEAFACEPFLHEGEDAKSALAKGTPRRRALDAALKELAQGREKPSTAWQRDFSLMLGLERVLSEDEPKLVDGTVLSAHQVDALSGTLIALLAEAQAHRNGAPPAPVQPPPPAREPEPATAARAEPKPAALDEDGDDLDEDEDEDPVDWHEPEDEDIEPVDWQEPEDEDAAPAEGAEDPGAGRRFWFEHATGAGKTVAAVGFVEASRTGGVLILTHRRNLVDQFNGELTDRGYRSRLTPALLDGAEPPADGPVTVETYQWFVRNAGRISDAYSIVICDEAHTALGEKTSATIRSWMGPVYIGMTATGALIARHVTDLFPTQTSRFDLAQAARRGVIAPLRCVRIPPGVGVRTIAKVPLRKGEVDQDFDQEELAALLDQGPFNAAVADLYRVRFKDLPGVVYAAGVRHAYNVAKAFRDAGLKAEGVSGETPKRELTRVLAAYERGEIDVLVNAQLLAEGWNSPRATVCMHLAPTASRRIYQQRVGRVTRRHPGKEAGIVVDFVHPGTTHDDPVITLHSLLDRDVYRGGAIVVGPVRRGRGRRMRVERRVLPVSADTERRREVFERELWRIAVELLTWGEQHVWAALAGARVAAANWRRARAMIQFDGTGELRRRFVITALQRNRTPAVRQKALQEVSGGKDAEAFDEAVETMAGWPRDERKEAVKILLGALAERTIGRRDQATAWLWRLAEYTREAHEEYAVQRWPETKRLLGLLVNSSGAAHARNARRLVHATRKLDRRLSAAILAAALAHTPEAEEVLRGARTRMARKPSALARELLRNFPKGKRRRSGGRRRKGRGAEELAVVAVNGDGAALDGDADLVTNDRELDEAVVAGVVEASADDAPAEVPAARSRRRRSRGGRTERVEAVADDAASEEATVPAAESTTEVVAEAVEADRSGTDEVAAEPVRRGPRKVTISEADPQAASPPDAATEEARPTRGQRTRRSASRNAASGDQTSAARPRRSRKPVTAAPPEAANGSQPPAAVTPATAAGTEAVAAATNGDEPAAPKPRRSRKPAAEAVPAVTNGDEPAAPKRRTRKPATEAAPEPVAGEPLVTRARSVRKPTKAVDPASDIGAEDAPKPRRTRKVTTEAAAATPDEVEPTAPKPRRTRKPTTETVPAADNGAEDAPKPRRTRKPTTETVLASDDDGGAGPAPRRAARKTSVATAPLDGAGEAAPKPRRTRKTTDAPAPAPVGDDESPPVKPRRGTRKTTQAEAA